MIILRVVKLTKTARPSAISHRNRERHGARRRFCDPILILVDFPRDCHLLRCVSGTIPNVLRSVRIMALGMALADREIHWVNFSFWKSVIWRHAMRSKSSHLLIIG